MNGRALAITSGLFVTATSVALIGTATAASVATADSSRTVAGHRPAARRPVGVPTELPAVDPGVLAHNDAVAKARFIQAVANVRWLEAIAANQQRAKDAAPRRTSGGNGDVLACIKHRESRGQYDVVNSSSGAAGAYQFMPGTWNTTARSAGRTDLVGVNPANASPADQDAMAHQLLATQGLGPWGGGCG
jgi:hypothetical protein